MRSVPITGSRVAPGPRRLWRTAIAVVLAVAFFAATAFMLSSGLGLVEAAQWATTQQRAYYEMMRHMMEARGSAFASLGLIGASLAYGFIHAAIPGHGKFLIAGAGIASRASVRRLVALSLAASLAQAVTAVVLVYGSFSVLSITAGWAVDATDKVLAPLSYLAILAIAIILIRRALRGFGSAWEQQAARIGAFATGRPAPAAQSHPHHAHHEHVHDHDEDGLCGCGHRHAPTLEEADALRSWKDAAMLIAGIGLRPCTGAVFVLAVAWRMNLIGVGIASAVAMALGTGAFISLVAVSAATARGATLFAAGVKHAGLVVPTLQLCAGISIALISSAFLIAPFIAGL
ncbi:nickel/cobalt transporter [Acuticoccus yangtzensis]|uniref:nickel/cobalt transporter n=1 Tax=Acuticoccus yangtzensis TaxID=1443441 RepID=UPI0009496DD4|nr:hypothetical protein [Acuticoccus yangtzensis]